MSKNHPPMTFIGSEVDPSGVYTVRLCGELWVVRRCGVLVGALPPQIVAKDGPLFTAQMLVGYGVFVSRRLYEMGYDAWIDEGFSEIVDKEVAAL